jgi:hypothetical protein
MTCIAEAREADQHHGPGLGDRAAHGEVEGKAAGPVSDKFVAEGQVDVGPEVGAQIEDAIFEETLGERQTAEGPMNQFVR